MKRKINMIKKCKYYEDNPLTRRRKAEEDSCSVEQRKKLDDLKNMHWKEYSLKKIKKQKITPKQGDVFLISPKENMFFYGVVVQEKPALIDNDDYWVVFILREPIVSEVTNEIPELDLYNVLIEPQIVMDYFWNNGFFYNIGQIEIPEDLDFGFYDVREPEGFVDKHGNHVDSNPTIWGGYWLVTFDGFGRKINRGIILSKLDEYYDKNLQKKGRCKYE